LLDPCNTEPSCLPAIIGPPSFKVKVQAAGTGVVNSNNGVGFVVVSPGLFLVNDWSTTYLAAMKAAGLVEPKRVRHTVGRRAVPLPDPTGSLAAAASAVAALPPASSGQRAAGHAMMAANQILSRQLGIPPSALPGVGADILGTVFVSGGTLPPDGYAFTGIPSFTDIANDAGDSVTGYYSNSPYSMAQFDATSSGYQRRLVSLCIDVSSDDTLLNQGGKVTLLCDPQHEGLTGLDSQELRANRQAVHVPFNQKEVSVIYNGPTNSAEMAYSSGLGVPTMLTADLTDGDPTKYLPNNFCMGLIINAPALSGGGYGASFDWRVTANYELVGPMAGIVGSGANEAGTLALTRSGVDPQGAGMVIEALQQARIDAGEEVPDNSPTFARRVKKTLLSLARNVMTFVVPKAAAAAGFMAGGPAGAMAANGLSRVALAPVANAMKRQERILKQEIRTIKGKAPKKKPNQQKKKPM